MFEIPDGYWEIVRLSDSIETDEYVDGLDRWGIVRFLREFKSSHGDMVLSRALLNLSDPVGRFHDEDVVQIAASRPITDQPMIRTKPLVREGGVGGGSSRGQQQQPSSGGSSISSPSGPAPEPGTFDSDSDGQAASLTSAAATGAPFCEECQKAQAGQ